MDIGNRLWTFAHAVARRLSNEAWAPRSDIPVEVGKMMERALRNGTAALS
jgi:hypothetical protein